MEKIENALERINIDKLNSKLKVYADKYKKLYDETNDIKEKFEKEYQERKTTLDELRKKFIYEEKEFYKQYLDKYVIVYNKYTIYGAKVTNINSLGPGNKCQLSGVIFSYYKDNGIFSECLYIKCEDSSHRMCSDCFTVDDDDVVKIYEEEEFFSILEQYMTDTFKRFKQTCQNSKSKKEIICKA
ncbi:MAG: hypothetical protein MJ237_06180 [bacterium]|nr:hypothetical protein [bacterium]